MAVFLIVLSLRRAQGGVAVIEVLCFAELAFISNLHLTALNKEAKRQTSHA
jgi:hypothetical protein